MMNYYCRRSRMLRGALGALLDLEDDIEVIGQAANGEEALKLMNR